MLDKKARRIRRHKKVRAKVKGTAEIPRLCVFRSARHIYAQLVDDEEGKTLVSVNDSKMKGKKSDSALETGKLLAKTAIEKKINKVVFDRGGYKYQGRVRAVAEGAREGGLKF